MHTFCKVSVGRLAGVQSCACCSETEGCAQKRLRPLDCYCSLPSKNKIKLIRQMKTQIQSDAQPTSRVHSLFLDTHTLIFQVLHIHVCRDLMRIKLSYNLYYRKFTHFNLLKCDIIYDQYCIIKAHK